MFALGDIAAVGYLAATGGVAGVFDSSQGNFVNDIVNYLQVFDNIDDQLVDTGKQIYNVVLTDDWWQPVNPGNNHLLEDQLGFSYRDRSREGSAYGYERSKFQFLETWWQTLGRMGYSESGEAWVEQPVQYQGENLYPWPGRINWVEDSTFLAYNESDSFLLFDGMTAVSRRAQQPDYEKPVHSDWKKQVCDGNYRL